MKHIAVKRDRIEMDLLLLQVVTPQAESMLPGFTFYPNYPQIVRRSFL